MKMHSLFVQSLTEKQYTTLIKFMFPLKLASKIYRRDLALQKAEDDQQALKILINKLNNDYNPASKITIKEKYDTLKTAKVLYSIRNDIINAFRKDIFLYIDGFQVKEEEIDEERDTTIMAELESKESAAERRYQQGEGVKIITPNQMLSRLPISLAQLKAGNNSEKLKTEIRQLLYSLYLLLLLLLKVYIIKMDTIFMNTDNSKTNKPHRFKLDLTEKLNLKNPKKNMALAYLSIYYT